jgi:hypothetical protein
MLEMQNFDARVGVGLVVVVWVWVWVGGGGFRPIAPGQLRRSYLVLEGQSVVFRNTNPKTTSNSGSGGVEGG